MLRSLQISIPAGVGSVSDPQSISGKIFAVREASAAFAVSFDAGNYFNGIERGDKLRLPYNSFQLRNLTASQVTVTVAVGDDDLEDYRPAVRPQIASQGLALWSGTYTGNNFATSQLVEAANPLRVEYTFVSPTTNVNTAFLISSQAAGKTIDLLYPGQRSTKQYGGAIYLHGGAPGADFIWIFATYY